MRRLGIKKLGREKRSMEKHEMRWEAHVAFNDANSIAWQNKQCISIMKMLCGIKAAQSA
jgi:hypothetical protein